MIPALTVLDDFLDDPEAFRALALKLHYEKEGRYPGRNSRENITLEGLDRLVSSFVRETVRGMSPQQSHARCRLALAEDDEPGRIHVDPSHWSGILYLSRPEDCRGGTEFYRHKRTNSLRVPRTEAELQAMGFDNYQQLRDEVIEKDALDRSKWDLTMNVPMVFNRLVLLQPQYWHTAGPGFGDSVENGRLVYVMFFRRVGS